MGMMKILKLPNIQKVVDIAYNGEQALKLLLQNIRDEGEDVKSSRLNKQRDSLS